MTDQLLKALYTEMYRIRAIEEAIANRYAEGVMRCPVHLSIGQELIPAIFALTIEEKDFAVSTHRGHAHYLAKGGNLNSMMAEIYGKLTGCSRGKGGSMHLIDLDVNFMGTSAIVGNSIPVGVGLALSAQLKKTSQISCIFMGDGATEEGVFFESVNFAAVRKIPALFICENNLYSVYSPISVRQPQGRSIKKLVEAMGVNGAVGDGGDIASCYEIMRNAIETVRRSGEPFFLEFYTYRWREHCGPNFDDDLGYRPAGEFDKWNAKDPLSKLEDYFKKGHQSSIESIKDIKLNIHSEIGAAFEFAAKSPFPNRLDAFDSVYL